MFDSPLFRKGADELGAELRTLRQQSEEKKRRREDLETLPLPREDLANSYEKLIDQKAPEYLEQLRRSMDSIIGRPLNEPKVLSCMSSLALTVGNHQINQNALVYCLSNMLKQGIRRGIMEMDYPAEVGPPQAERLAEVERLDNEIGKLEAKEEKLLGEAKAAIASIEPLERPTRPGAFAGGMPLNAPDLRKSKV